MSVAFDATVLVDFFNRKLNGDRRAKLDDLVATLLAKSPAALAVR